jgi:hypothetical protein
LRILDFRGCYYGLPEIAAEVGRSTKIDFPAKDLGEFKFHSRETNQSHSLSRLEFDKNIRAKVFPENRAEKRELTNVMALTKRGELFLVNRNFCAHRSNF